MQITRGRMSKPQKVVVYGPEGVGKSTFASQFPDPLFIDTEDSTVTMDVARFPKPTSWTMLLSQVDHVKRNPGICKTLIVDTADWAERLCAEHICATSNVKGIEDFGYGKGYVYLEEEFGRFLNRLQEIIEVGINVVVTAHAEIKKIEQPEEIGGFDHWQLKLEKKTMPLLKEWSDILLLANYKVHVVNVDNQGAAKGKNKAQGGKRIMYTTHTPWWDAKNRHSLPDEIPFEYKAIAHCIPGNQEQKKPAPDINFLGDEPSKSEKPDIIYWHHPESSCVFTAKPGERQDALCVELTKEEFEKLKHEYEELDKKAANRSKQDPSKQEPPKQQPPKQQPVKNELQGLPKPLADLMMANSVTVTEIQQAVASRGYYPINTPIEKYDPDFIAGVCVGAWEQVFQMIKDFRNDEPF